MVGETVPDTNSMTKFSDSHYCRTSKAALLMLGLWPKQGPLEQKLKTGFILFCLALSAITQMLKLLSDSFSFELLVEVTAPLTVMAAASVKVYTYYKNRDLLKALLNETDMNYSTLRDNREIEIMENNMTIGKFHATVYIVYIYMALFLFVVLVFEPYVLDIVLPLNESRPVKLAYPAEYYFLNERDHFPIIISHVVFSCWLAVTVLIATDSMYIIYVRCGCSLFSIAGHRFACAIYEDDKVDKFAVKWEQRNINRMEIAVPIHNQAIKYIQQLEVVFAMPSLLQVGMSVICLIFTLMEAMILIGKLEMVRFAFFVGASLIHLFCYCYQGQLVIDETHKTADTIYNGPWYNAPKEMQNALLFVLMRFTKLSHMTAGKVIILSIENYSSMVKNCMSYFTVLASFR